jgi:hypothetical protein
MKTELQLSPQEQLRKNWTLVRWGLAGCWRALFLLFFESLHIFYKNCAESVDRMRKVVHSLSIEGDEPPRYTTP